MQSVTTPLNEVPEATELPETLKSVTDWVTDFIVRAECEHHFDEYEIMKDYKFSFLQVYPDIEAVIFGDDIEKSTQLVSNVSRLLYGDQMDPELGKFVASLFTSKADEIISVFEKQQPGSSEFNTFARFLNLVRRNKIDETGVDSEIRNSLWKYKTHFESLLDSDFRGERLAVLQMVDTVFSDELIYEPNSDFSKKVLGRLIEVANNDDYGDAIKGELLWGYLGKRARLDKHILEATVCLGLKDLVGSEKKADDYMHVWRECGDKTGYFSKDSYSIYYIANQNMKTMQELAYRRSKTSEKGFEILDDLNTEFGIYNFGRYTQEMLVRQYDLKDHDVPYGVIMNPLSDYSGAFYGDSEVFGKLMHDTEADFQIRIVEVDGRLGRKNSIGRALYNLNNRYGEKNKISFAIVGGHGNQNAFTLGESIRESGFGNFMITEPVARRIKSLKVRSAFTEDASVILNSCLVAKEYESKTRMPLAQELGELLDMPTIGPDEITALRNIQYTKVKGKHKLIPEYYKANTRVFSRGKSDTLTPTKEPSER